MSTHALPQDLYKYFWDIRPDTLNIQEKKQYVIERLLEYGDEYALKWMQDMYENTELTTSLKHAKTLSRKSASFYAWYFNLDPNTILCLQKDFQHKHRQIWKH